MNTIKKVLLVIICTARFCFALYTPPWPTHASAPYYPGHGQDQSFIIQNNPALPAIYGTSRIAGGGLAGNNHVNFSEAAFTLYGFFADTFKKHGRWGVGMYGLRADDWLGKKWTGGFTVATGYRGVLFAGLGIKNAVSGDINFDLGAVCRLSRVMKDNIISMTSHTGILAANLRPDSYALDGTNSSGALIKWYLPVPFYITVNHHTTITIKNILATGVFASYTRSKASLLDTDRDGTVTAEESAYIGTTKTIILGIEMRLFNILGISMQHKALSGQVEYNEPDLLGELLLQYNSRRLKSMQDKPYDIHLRGTMDDQTYSFSTTIYYDLNKPENR